MTPTASRLTALFALLSLFALPAIAQISIPSTFYTGKAGTRETEDEFEADDDGGLPPTVPCATAMLGASGTNQTWNFTACTYSSPALTTITDYGTDVSGDVPLGDDPAFSTANFYAREYETDLSSEASSWGVLQVSASEAVSLGFVGVEEAAPDYDTTLVLNSPPSKAVEFPLAYGTTWYDSTTFSVDGGVFAYAEDNLIDGWGQIVTPGGTADALRLDNERRTYLFTGSMWMPTGTQYTYEFLTQDAVSAFIYHNGMGTATGAGYIVTSSSTLPVELASFDAVRDGRRAHLRWKTLSETNNSGFGIEHALDAEAFREVAFVDGAGTIDGEREYSLTIDLERTGVHHFRLRQVDLDGTFSYSAVVELNYETPDRFALLPAYPNPFNPSTTIAFELATSSEVSLDVYDMLGQRVRHLAGGRHPAGRHEVAFDATGLPSGLYTYRLVTGSLSATRSMLLLK